MEIFLIQEVVVERLALHLLELVQLAVKVELVEILEALPEEMVLAVKVVLAAQQVQFLLVERSVTILWQMLVLIMLLLQIM
jgi:hypothetical protein